jgi:arginase
MTTTRLFFPQWQGVGFATDMALAAQALRQHLEAEFELKGWREVALDPSPELPVERGVIARRAVLAQLTEALGILRAERATRTLTLGGDCGIELVPLGWLNAAYAGDVALVWVDAHADLNTPQTSPSASFHGMPLRALLGEGDPDLVAVVQRPLQPSQVFMVGVREFDPPEWAYVQEYAIPVFHPQREGDALDALVAAVRAGGFRRVYLHVDLDSLDPSVFPQVPFRAAGGLTVGQVVAVADRLRGAFELVGMSLTEYDSAAGENLAAIAPLLRVFAEVGA